MYKFCFLVNYQFEVIMKPKWKDEEIKKLFYIVEENNKKNKPIIDSFREFAKLTNRNFLTVRNFYYMFVKLLQQNVEYQKKLNIDLSKHQIQKFEHFDKADELKFLTEIERLKSLGYSTRSACLQMSNGDIKTMLRLQNKYRNLKDNQTKTKVIKMPTNNFIQSNETKSIKLSDEEIKSLFMGLVRVVKESANIESAEQTKKIFEQAEKDSRKALIELEAKQFEIERLSQQNLELKAKNSLLNQTLKNYRIEKLKLNTNNQLNLE